jgi:TonB family protein
MLTLSNAQGAYVIAIGPIVDQMRLTFKLQRDLFQRQLQPVHLLDDRQGVKKQELDAVLDEFLANLNELTRKFTEWDSVKTLVAATYDQLFSEEELAGIVAFYKTPIGQAYARKMPEVVTRTGQLARDAAQTLKPEIMRLAQQTAAKAIQLGYVWIPAPAGGAAGGIVPGRNEGGVIGGIIGSVPTAAVAPPPPAGAATAPHPERMLVGANVQQAKLIQQAKPVYPPLARQARIEGHVILNAVIAKDGTIEDLTFVKGHPLLVPAAMEAVKQWVYAPTLVNGEPVEVMTQIDVNFTLSVDAAQ